MDPNANLEELLSLARSIEEDYEDESCEVDLDDAVRLAELALALDEWITKGGFLPKRWSDAQRRE